VEWQRDGLDSGVIKSSGLLLNQGGITAVQPVPVTFLILPVTRKVKVKTAMPKDSPLPFLEIVKKCYFSRLRSAVGSKIRNMDIM